ncbi:Hypothetical protein PHPALM_11102 [Phytophthora palmivora]|uniref:Eukaryotic/viral aspartic protease n=1 Tax=Phytophthora palmivora TaxID=4796 RepID=A0A2P4Y358_9STRA|nr:Hypothetical protein PHPALM_11102 [Phytophthora palmivora]
MSELKEFAGKEGDEDRARLWLSEVKPAFVRDQAPDEEKWLDKRKTGIDSLVAQHAAPERICSAASVFNIVDEECQPRGNITSRARYRTNFRWGICIESMWQGLGPASRSWMDLRKFDGSMWSTSSKLWITTILQIIWPYYEFQMLTLWNKHFDLGSEQKHAKPRLKSNNAAALSASTRAISAVNTISDSSESEEDSSGSDGEAGLRRVYIAASGNNEGQQDQDQRNQDRSRSEVGNNRTPQDRQDIDSSPKRCSHCGSRKHSDLGCWGRLTCEKTSSDRCLFTCKACGDIHEAGKCTMEECYNLIRQWYNPIKHAGMLPKAAEKMLN